MPAKPVKVGFLAFDRTGDAVTFFRSILNKYDRGDKVSSKDAEYLNDLLKMHPNSAEKVGPGIESFSVRTADFGTRCFWVNRVDGTTEKFSFRKCLTSSK